MRCLKPCFLSSHGIRGRSETRFDNSVSRPDLCVVTVGPVGRLGPRLCRWMSHPARCTRAFPSRRPYAACLHITSLTGLFRAFRAASCSAHRIRYGLHAAQTGFLFTGHSGYFPAGVPGVFAFPARREEIIANSLKQCQGVIANLLLCW